MIYTGILVTNDRHESKLSRTSYQYKDNRAEISKQNKQKKEQERRRKEIRQLKLRISEQRKGEMNANRQPKTNPALRG